VLNLLLKLFALRPLFSIAIFGIPIVALVLIGLFAVAAVKLVVFVAVPLVLVLWAWRALRRSSPAP
jgi:hypothetical protein